MKFFTEWVVARCVATQRRHAYLAFATVLLLLAPARTRSSTRPGSLDIIGSLQLAKTLGRKNRWHETKMLLNGLLKSCPPSGERLASITRAMILLGSYEACQQTRDLAGARRAWLSFRLEPEQHSSPLRGLFEAARIRWQTERRCHLKPTTASAPADAVQKLKLSIQRREATKVRLLCASTLSQTQFFDSETPDQYVQALIGLALLYSWEHETARSRALLTAAKHLIEAVPSGLFPFKSFVAEDLADVGSFLGGALRKGSAYRPVNDPYLSPAVQASKQEAMGFGPTALLALKRYMRFCENSGADSCLVVWRSHIVGEWYSSRYSAEPVNCESSTKSVATLLTGLLIKDGRLKSIEQRVGEFLPAWRGGMRGQVTLRHLLTMTSGITDVFGPEGLNNDGRIADVNSYVATEMEPTALPGTVWSYANYGVQLLSPILQKAAGQPLNAYARRRLFDPLGIARDSGLSTDLRGGTFLYSGARFRARELARLGQLMINEGRWRGTQLLPSSWIRSIGTPCSLRNDYGLLWWLGRPPGSLAMEGSLNNLCVVAPSSDLVVVRQQGWRWTLAAKEYSDGGSELLEHLTDCTKR